MSQLKWYLVNFENHSNFDSNNLIIFLIANLLHFIRKWLLEEKCIQADVLSSLDDTELNFHIIFSKQASHLFTCLVCHNNFLAGTLRIDDSNHGGKHLWQWYPLTITFDAGGKEFQISCKIIEKQDCSMLAGLVSDMLLQDFTKPTFIDCIHNIFGWVLDYLCYNSVTLPNSIKWDKILCDMDFYDVIF